MFAANTAVVTLILLVSLVGLGVLFARWLGLRRPSQVVGSDGEQLAGPTGTAVEGSQTPRSADVSIGGPGAAGAAEHTLPGDDALSVERFVIKPLDVKPFRIVPLDAAVTDGHPSDDAVTGADVVVEERAVDAPAVAVAAGDVAVPATPARTAGFLRREPGIVVAVEPPAADDGAGDESGDESGDDSSALADVDVDMDGDGDEVAAVEDEDDDQVEDDDEVVARLDRAASLHTTLEQARSRVQALEEERQAQLEGLDQVAREYRRRGALVRSLRADVATSDEQWMALEADLAAAREQTERVDRERISLLRRAEAGEYLGVQLNAQLDDVREELQQAEASMSELRSTIDARDQRIRDVEAALAFSEAERRMAQTSLAGRDERVRRLEQSLAVRDERLRAVESELAELSGRIVEFEGRSAGF